MNAISDIYAQIFPTPLLAPETSVCEQRALECQEREIWLVSHIDVSDISDVSIDSLKSVGVSGFVEKAGSISVD